MYNLGCNAELQQLKMESTSPEPKKEHDIMGIPNHLLFLSLHIA
jgi:hypothetical protein